MTRTRKPKTETRAIKARTPAKPRPARLSAETQLKELKARLLEINDLNAAGSVLSWDHATYMPDGGAVARARQGATLSRLAHEKSVDRALGKLLDALGPYAASQPHDSDDACLIRVARRDFEKAIRVPPDHVARANAHGSASYDAWTRARPADDFAVMRPFLEKALELSREYAGYFAPYRHVADPLIDDADEGMTTASIRALFTELRRELVPLVRAVADQAPADDGCLRGRFPERLQLDFALSVVRPMGYDLAHGRLDKTHHPFCAAFSPHDVRITTRVDGGHIGEALFSTLHEAGHAMYEQGVSGALEGTPLAHGASAGVHESQSRLWENVVARGLGFWRYFFPLLRQTFPDQFKSVALENFYRAINKVERSLIRVDADELTYNLHVMLRFELELQMLEGKLPIKDLPEAWREGMRTDLGVVPPDDRDGCLQDVHWYAGGIGGAFQSYTIGNILSAQFYAAAVAAHPEIPADMENGKFDTLYTWLRHNIYRHGRKYPPNELIERTTGGPLNMRPYIAYLRTKYGELYRLPNAGAAAVAASPAAKPS